jgi:DNA-binding NtrC family response regulator
MLAGTSSAMSRIRGLIQEVAPTKASVLITGESGTGKEVVARAIHRLSGRTGQFAPVNMSALPPGLTESLLFGHERGAFTGANGVQVGYFEAAEGGTLFLDEICELELHLQPKILRCLQESVIQRVGSPKTRKVDVRVIAATNQDASKMVKAGTFRSDLYYRLLVVPIHLPPLRERPGDIAELAMEFVRQASQTHGKQVEGFNTAACEALCNYHWPGNVRQLENLVERLVIFTHNRLIEAWELPEEIRHAEICQGLRPESQQDALTVGESAVEVEILRRLTPLQRSERRAIIDALERMGGHVIKAAKYLGLGQATVYRRIKQYAIPRPKRPGSLPSRRRQSKPSLASVSHSDNSLLDYHCEEWW